MAAHGIDRLLQGLGLAPVRVSDARGRLVLLLKPNATGKDDAVLRGLVRRGIAPGAWLHLAVMCILATLIVYLQAKPLYRSFGRGFQQEGDWYPVIITACELLVVWSIWAALRHRHSSGIVRQLLGRGRCASCGYLLTSLSKEMDDTVVCPECGSAWKLPSVD